MGAPENEHIFGIQMRESADDGSDFTNADADYRKLFLGEDGFLHVKDSAGSVTDPYDTSGGGGALVAYDIERRTAGDLTINSTSAGNAFPTISSNVVAASTGDVLEIGLSCVIDSSAGALRIDVATIVSAAQVNFVSSLGGTPAAVGLPNWRSPGSVEVRPGGSIIYVVQAGDIDGGNVTLQLCGWVSSGSKNIQASTNSPFVFWVKNVGQP